MSKIWRFLQIILIVCWLRSHLFLFGMGTVNMVLPVWGSAAWARGSSPKVFEGNDFLCYRVMLWQSGFEPLATAVQSFTDGIYCSSNALICDCFVSNTLRQSIETFCTRVPNPPHSTLTLQNWAGPTRLPVIVFLEPDQVYNLLFFCYGEGFASSSMEMLNNSGGWPGKL